MTMMRQLDHVSCLSHGNLHETLQLITHYHLAPNFCGLKFCDLTYHSQFIDFEVPNHVLLSIKFMTKTFVMILKFTKILDHKNLKQYGIHH